MMLSLLCLVASIAVVYIVGISRSDQYLSASAYRSHPTSNAPGIASAAISESANNESTGNHVPRNSPIIFHIIPHSHCDAAYKKTFDEYYETEVRNVLSSTVMALQTNATRRFVWAETIYLTRWWKDPRTNRTHQDLFQQFVAEGRIELVNGGWVMHDEGITRYDTQIHQMTEGHDRIQQIFQDGLHRPNVTITTGWQIDPFGPSPFSVNLHQWAGMNLLVLNRMPANIKDAIKANQTLQFYWETEQAKILVHVMDTHYGSPEGFDWEDLEHDSSVPINSTNIRNRSDVFMDVLLERATYYRTPHVMVPMGGDFTFQNASLQFRNMEKIFTFVQAHPELYGPVVFRYSTPAEYREAITNAFLESNETIPVVHGGVEFQPLLAGYYFQLPNLKQMLRTSEVVMRHIEVRIYQAINRNVPWRFISEWVNQARSMRESIALMQHHDAITATSYRFVIADYIQRLTLLFERATRLLSCLEGQDDHSKPSSALGKIIGGGPYIHESVLVRETHSAHSISIHKVLSPQMGYDGTILVVLNSLPHETTTMVHFVCTRDDVAISLVHNDDTVEPVQAQATPLDHELESGNLGLFLISFLVTIPGLGHMHYRVQVCDLTWNTFQDPPAIIPHLECAHKAQTLDASQLVNSGLVSSSTKIRFNKSTLELESIHSLQRDGSELSSRVDNDFILYYGGNDTIYEFTTNVESSDPPPLYGSRRRRFISGFQGPLFSQVTLEYTPWLSVRYRLENTIDVAPENSLQVTVFAGPLPQSVNLASRFRLGWPNTEWFVDENGFLPVRVSYNSSHGVGDGNTRPLVSRSWVQNDQGQRLTVSTVDPRGVVSKREGEIDVFWHRRNNGTTDWWKQGDDRSSIVSSIWLSLTPSNDSDELHLRRQATQRSNDAILLAIDPQTNKFNSKTIHPRPQTVNELSQSLHTVTLRISQLDPELKKSREEAWMDVQIENLSGNSSERVDLLTFLTNSTNVIFPEATLNSLTYLQPDSADISSGCALDVVDGGLSMFLSILPRSICSIRIPVAPISHEEVTDSSFPTN